MQKYHKNKALKYVEVAEALLKTKVATPTVARQEQLAEVYKEVTEGATDSLEMLTVAMVNMDPSLVIDTHDKFLIVPKYLEMDLDNEWQAIRKVISAAAKAEVVILGVRGHVLSPQERGLLSATFISGRPAIVYWPSCQVPDMYAESLTLRTWPVITAEEALSQYVREELPKRVTLFSKLLADLSSRVEKYKKVNVAGHLVTRLPISLVPFGLVGFNSFRTLKLVRKVMRDTGLQLDESNKKAVLLETGKAAVKSTSVESTSDVFQFFVAASVLSEFTADLVADGITAAAEGVELADALLVGAAAGVGGIASTIGQCLSRPVLVEGLASLAAMMQMVYLINPAMRRPEKAAASDAAASATQGLLADSDSS